MDPKKTKQYLSRIGRLEKRIQYKLAEIHHLRMLACGITVSNEGDRVQTSGEKDKISAVVARIVDMEQEVDKMIDGRRAVVEQIEKIENDNYYDILINKYVLQKDLKEIAIEKGYTYRHVQRLYAGALAEFERLYGKLYLKMS